MTERDLRWLELTIFVVVWTNYVNLFLTAPGALWPMFVALGILLPTHLVFQFVRRRARSRA
jgi:hypothetical protein